MAYCPVGNCDRKLTSFSQNNRISYFQVRWNILLDYTSYIHTYMLTLLPYNNPLYSNRLCHIYTVHKLVVQLLLNSPFHLTTIYATSKQKSTYIHTYIHTYHYLNLDVMHDHSKPLHSKASSEAAILFRIISDCFKYHWVNLHVCMYVCMHACMYEFTLVIEFSFGCL
jgi:hypothetical protein